MNRRFLTGLFILVCLSLIVNECYAWPPEPDVYISDWHKYTTVGEDVEVYAEVVNSDVAGPIYYWDWDWPSALNGTYDEYDYDSTATFYSYTPGRYTVYAEGTDYYGQWDDDWAYVYVIDVEIDTPSSFPAYVELGENLSLGSILTPASAGGGTYSWTKVTGPGTVTFSPSASDPDPDFSANQSGNYTVKVSYTKGGATASDTSGTITVVKVVNVISSKNFACIGENVTFGAITDPLNMAHLVTVTWSGGQNPATGSGSQFITNWSTPGTKTVTATCGTSSAYKDVTVVEVKDVTFDPKVLRADGSFTSTASATIIPSGRTLTWSIQGVNQGCLINQSTGVITAGTGTGTITVRAADSELSTCYAEAQIKVVKLQELTVSGAVFFAGTSPVIYTTAQQAGTDVTITAVLTPSVSVADLPTNFVTWTNGTAGANQLERLVSRGTANTDVTVTANCARTKSVRIYVRRVDPSNPTVTPTEQVTSGSAGGGSYCQPSHPVLNAWHATSVGILWHARVDTMTCAGTVNVSAWPSLPSTMAVPNTANPVTGGNINNTPGSPNRWSYAQWDLGNYDTSPGGGAGGDWHNTAASSAHEWYHWNTDWMVSCIGTAGNWSGTEIDIENLNVSVYTYLTEADAKTALTASVNSRFTTFDNAAWNHLLTVIVPADVPGGGGGGYAAGQAVLNGDIAAIESYRLSQGW